MISLYARRKIADTLATGLMYAATLVGLFFLIWILWTTLHLGASAMHWDLFLRDTPAPGSDGYGLRNAFVGSLILLGVALAIGIPIGVMAGTWLAEYGGRSRGAGAVRYINDIMLSAPSIEIGLFTYAIMVDPMGHFSALSGGVALALLAIPIIVRTTDEMLALVGREMREAAFALGTPMWKVVTQVTWKGARAGIVTGVLLAVARISGETAPLLFTALNNQYFSTDIRKPMANLPVVIFQFAMSPYANWQQMAWAGAFIIIVFVLLLGIAARLVFNRGGRHA